MCKVPSLVFLSLVFLSLVFGVVFLPGSGSLLAQPAAYQGPDPCRLATGADSPVDKACREGGIKAAKVAMKDLLREGRKAGVKHECDDCHLADDDYSKLSEGAAEKFAKLVAAVSKSKK